MGLCSEVSNEIINPDLGDETPSDLFKGEKITVLSLFWHPS
jgi:hypothetical protein